MQKLPEVEAARTLMAEAMSWSVMTWLTEKKRVRKTADLANAALDQLNLSVKNQWTNGVRATYEALLTERKGTNGHQRPNQNDPQAIALARRVKEADDEASRARAEAEETFDQAEKKLSTVLAREGCRKAIRSWDLHEKAIRQAEAVLGSK